MPRIGTNPARKKTMLYTPQKITVAVMVYIPHQQGYFKNRFEIFRLCIASLRIHTKVPFDLLVLSNGSCKEIVDQLREMQDKGSIDYLIISGRNQGVIGGYKMIFSAAPGSIVAYCDDDVVFYPDWLEEQLKVMKAFSNVGMVSGVPVRSGADHANQSIQSVIENPPKGIRVEKTRKIPDEWERDWCISTGRDPEEHLESTKQKMDIVLSKNGVEAIASANHFQFIAPKDVILKALPEDWSKNLMDSLVPLEERVDQMGYLRLSTTGRFCRHIGNTISRQVMDEFHSVNVDIRSTAVIKKRHWLLKIPGMGRFLWALYDTLFRMLNQVK